MSNPLHSIKLGQSLWQDTFFVANAQLTPYRKLRQLELELSEIDITIKKANIQLKRQEIYLQRMNPADPIQALDIEEMKIGEEQTKRLLEDAVHRRDNFLKIREQLLSEVPQEYWDQGFENAEFENWTKHFAKQLSISMVTGIPNAQLIEQLSNLPIDMVKQVMIEAKVGANQFLLLDKSTTEGNKHDEKYTRLRDTSNQEKSD